VEDSALLSVELEHRDQPVPAVVARLAGELDYGTTPRLLTVIGDIPDSGTDLVLDLRSLAFCDSSALGALVALHKRATAAGGRMFLAGPRPQVRDAIEVTSLDQLLQLRESLDQVYAEIGAR
jgi:anti-sigma B factor antagonist